MKQKTIGFQLKPYLETNGHAQTLCKIILKHGYHVCLVTDLPEQEFANHICDFTLDVGIYHKNILFRKTDIGCNPVKQLKLKLFFSAIEF